MEMAMESAAAGVVDIRSKRAATPEIEIICTVCVDLISDHGPTIVTECGHGFHERCLQSWFDKGAEDAAIKTFGDCPVCNERIFMGACRKYYPSTQEKMAKHTVPHETFEKAMEEIEVLKTQLEATKAREPKQLSKTVRSTRAPVPAAAASTKAPIMRARTAASAASALANKPKAAQAPPKTAKKVMLKLPKQLSDPLKKTVPGASKQMEAKTLPTRTTRSAKATSGSSASSKLVTVNGESKPSSAKSVKKDVAKPAPKTTSDKVKTGDEGPPKKRVTRQTVAATKTNGN